ncbi:MAG: hypothetical protein LC749_05990, partial [Actinobacteria bacterium]|nr:hypothetical protein [Actinomycetota bacterium]
TRSTDVAALTAGLPLLVVIPEGGTKGYYSDWFNEGRGGPPARVSNAGTPELIQSTIVPAPVPG